MVDVPEHYAREIEERERILEACPIEVYTSSINPRWAWPYKLNASNEARPSTRESCKRLMIDPGLRNPACSLEIANAAHRTDADYVLARDLSPENPLAGDRDDRHLRSVETAVNYVVLQRDLRRLESYKVGRWECANDAEVVVPIQPPYDVSLAYLARDFRRRDLEGDETTVNVLDEVGYFAIGGLLSISDVDERIRQLRYVRERLGDEVRIHALAPGLDVDMISALRSSPGLVDSIDVSTPESAVKNGKIPFARTDEGLRQRRTWIPRGEDSTTVRAGWSGAIALQVAYALSPLCDDPEIEAAEISSTTPDVSASPIVAD